MAAVASRAAARHTRRHVLQNALRQSPTAVLTVKREGTQLFAELSGQPQFPIFATADNRFEWRAVLAQVRFVKREDGRVTKAVHTQNGATFDASRIK